ncbi:MAG: signal peptidase I [Chloroflexi bacterium]|nr:signal peptidase I [Chloroflexota bacterium]
MQHREHRRAASIGGLLTIVIAVVVLALFAPTSIGGPFSYAIVTGDSMSPRLATNDIVLLRRKGSYSVGDVIAYRHPQIGTVLHRIVAYDGAIFTTQGDNRPTPDAYQSVPGDVLGREWGVIPQGGRVVREVQRPRNAALLAIAVVAVLATTGVQQKRRGDVLRTPLRQARARWSGDLSAYAPNGRLALGAVTGLALGSVALLGLWAINGSTIEVSEGIPLTEQGSFTYGGSVGAGVYDEDILAAPEPLFRRVLNELPMSYDYHVTSDDPDVVLTNVLGSFEITAQVQDENGWKRTFALQPSTTFAGDHFVAASGVDLATIDALLDAVAELTGLESGLHRLSVFASVSSRGELDGIAFERTFDQSITFLLTELKLQYEASTSELNSSTGSTVPRLVTVPRLFNPPVLPVSVSYARLPAIAVLLLALAAIGAGTVGTATLLTWRLGATTRIRAVYGRLIVELQEADPVISARSLRVNHFEDLVRVAESEGVAIMHRESDAEDDYVVVARDVTWRFLIPKRRQRQPGLITATEG